MILFKKKRIELGKGHIIQYTLFENKKFGGIWLYNWKTIDQNRFHTHAFKSIAFTLSGGYAQEVIKDGEIQREHVKKLFRPRFLPRNYCHRILDAKPNTWTMVIFGKWIPYWWEYFSDSKTWVKYTWGRKVVDKKEGDETGFFENIPLTLLTESDFINVFNNFFKGNYEYSIDYIDSWPRINFKLKDNSPINKEKYAKMRDLIYERKAILIFINFKDI